MAKQGWDQAALRVLQAAPPVAELRAWMHWDALFQASVGSLRDFLERQAPGCGLCIFELPGARFLKLDAAKGTCEAFEAALLAADSLAAAEAMLAFIHSSKGMRSEPLQALRPGYRKAAAQLQEAFPALAGQLLTHLPRPFIENLEVIRLLLEPFRSEETALVHFAEAQTDPFQKPFGAFCAQACGALLAEHAALVANVPRDWISSKEPLEAVKWIPRMKPPK
ncbi:unnamed protein product [Effrenium voratum]|nr:unnamed protein product [Effrenium voratum]